jgi:hypothetical protein
MVATPVSLPAVAWFSSNAGPGKILERTRLVRGVLTLAARLLTAVES